MNGKICELCGATLDIGERCCCYRLHDPQEQENIRILYREAANKATQLDILCDLYDTSRSKIIEVLGDMYIPGEAKRETARVVRLKALATAYAAAGESNAVIAQRLGISESYASSFAAPVRKAAKAAQKDPIEELL